jgi:hypothetical protein
VAFHAGHVEIPFCDHFVQFVVVSVREDEDERRELGDCVERDATEDLLNFEFVTSFL